MISLLDPPKRLVLSITQLVRLAKRAYIERTCGCVPRFCYLPGELFDLFEMVVQAEMEELLLNPSLTTAVLIAYDGMTIREHDGLEIIVTEVPL